MSGREVTQVHTPPPEGVVTGDSVPLENQQDDFEEAAIQTVMNRLKASGEPYREMNDSELREKAREFIEKHT